MKTIIKMVAISAAFLTYTTTTNAQSADSGKGKYETIEMQVKGACGMCQSRIELAVYDLKGVKSAKWDLQTDKLTAVVKKGKVSKEQIADALAEAGHSNELKKAKLESYAKLPDCCKYDDGVQKHGKGIDR